MKYLNLTLANKEQAVLELFDPVAAEHIGRESSYVGTLLHQINVEKIYASLFEGRQDLTFLDLGANIGLVSIYATPSCKRIVSVEPAPETFKVLKAMTLKYPKIECVNAALAPQDGPCTFFQNDLNTTASSTVNTYGTPTSVPGLKLSSILRINQLERVDVVKVDCEGAEGESLTFAELENAEPIVKTWICEVHNCPRTTWQYKLSQLMSDLLLLGYYKQSINGMCLTASK